MPELKKAAVASPLIYIFDLSRAASWVAHLAGRSCETCYMVKKTRADGMYFCEYYGLWVRGTKECMAYIPRL
ncbi:MAG: hypothetical protein QXT74_05770 [Candidatus Nezhaarchaeales archaeon]